MSSCSNSCQTSFFRHRDTAETDAPKSDAISVSVFPAKDISHAVKIVFVFERRILNSSRKCVKISFSTLYVVNSTLLNAPCQLKITKYCVFLRKKRKTHQKKCEIHKKSVKYIKSAVNNLSYQEGSPIPDSSVLITPKGNRRFVKKVAFADQLTAERLEDNGKGP